MKEEKSWQEKLNAKRVKSIGWSGCEAPDGWKDLVLKTDEMLAFIDPEYEVNQIKEKFGTLRYYFNSEKTAIEFDIMMAIVNWAELKSSSTCDTCGSYGQIRKDMNWIRTLCNSCSDERLKNAGL